MIHHFGDATTSNPLWIAFALAHRKASKEFTYGYGRVEDLAGMAIVLLILFSVTVAGYESINRLFHPQVVEHLWEVTLASLVGFFGNEIVAVYRCRTGNEINSAALVADGCHARVDGLTSLAVFLGALLIGGVDPEVVDEVKEAASHVAGVKEVTNVRVRWLGHQLHAEINLAVRIHLCSMERNLKRKRTKSRMHPLSEVRIMDKA